MSKIVELVREMEKSSNMNYDKLKSNLKSISPTRIDFENIMELVDFVYYMGIDDGETFGYKESLKDNYNYEENDDYYDRGFEDGRREGYDDGFVDGEREGQENGYEIGRDEGYNNGHDDGYEEARSEFGP